MHAYLDSAGGGGPAVEGVGIGVGFPLDTARRIHVHGITHPAGRHLYERVPAAGLGRVWFFFFFCPALTCGRSAWGSVQLAWGVWGARRVESATGARWAGQACTTKS